MDHTLSEDGKGGPPNNGIVLGQYQTRRIDMASAYATLAASGVYHKPHFVQKVVNSDGQVLFDAGQQDNSGEQRIDKAVADNVTSAMQPIAGYSSGHNLAGGRPSAAKTGTNQLGDTGANRDAWMVGYTPSLSTAVWVGTTEGDQAAGERLGRHRFTARVCRRTSGRRRWTVRSRAPTTSRSRSPTEIGGYAGVPRRRHRRRHRAAAAVGDGHSADDRSGAGHHDPDRAADHGARRAAGARRTRARAAGSAAAWTSSAPVTER